MATTTYFSRFAALLTVVTIPVIGQVSATSTARADNNRLNNSVVANVYTIQHQAGCTNNVIVSPPLRLAAQWHTLDVLNNGALDGDIGSDGSTAQDRAQAAGFHGRVAETVAINPSIAINNMDILNQWYYNPQDLAIMQDCQYTRMGVWSENSPSRSVVVAVYGHPE
ncbi:CAP domain-containing protein [Mycobacterium sp. E1747]|uniref:CAP domain-containing protein n=1 Tax=Mycobacterium sp. E1747 TaxID=1834128 RepID=UPI000A72507C